MVKGHTIFSLAMAIPEFVFGKSFNRFALNSGYLDHKADNEVHKLAFLELNITNGESTKKRILALYGTWILEGYSPKFEFSFLETDRSTPVELKLEEVSNCLFQIDNIELNFRNLTAWLRLARPLWALFSIY